MEKQISKIAICHHTLTSLGGGERVGVSLIDALNKTGIVPDVYTTSPIDLTYLQNFYGKKIECKLHTIMPFAVRLFGIYQRLVASMHSFRLIGYDVVVNTTGIYVPIFLKSFIKRYIIYIYNPLVPIYPFAVKGHLKYERSLFWKLYFQPYQNIIRTSIKRLGNNELLAVSNFTKWRIEKYWNKQSTTVYPPVDIETFSQIFGNTDRDGVISIARFTPEKNHILQLEIAKQLPDLTFRICGSAKTPYYWHWFQHVKAEAEKMNLSNVEFYPTVLFNKLIELVGKSKYFLHTMFNEDFGLTTAETIAGGCLPVVHNSGGQREVVPYRRLRFDNVEEAVKIIVKADKMSKGELGILRSKLFTHIQQFDESNFKKNMLRVIFNANT